MSTSELRTIMPYKSFCRAFEEFLKQADQNAVTKKSGGSKSPFGIVGLKKARSGKLLVDGGELGQQYGQGAASRTPYFNWHVLSIYYVTELQRIVLGIEVDRYHSLEKLPPYLIKEIPGRNTRVAVFDECPKSKIDYEKLYDSFISLSEEIMSIGL